MLKKLTLAILGMLLFHLSYGQENYLPGYVISLEGEMIKGLIDYRNWERNPSLIDFKKEGSEAVLRYSPVQIKGFQVKDEIYAGGIVKAELTPTGTNALHQNPDFVFRVDTTFLQALVLGDKSLYQYKTSEGKDNFYILTNAGFDLLLYKKYKRSTYILENKKYLEQLAGYLGECPTIHSSIENLKYSRKSMQQLFLTHYSCTASPIKFQKQIEKVEAHFGILAGGSRTSVKFESQSVPHLATADFEPSTDVTAGISLDIVFPRSQKKWSLYNELVYASYTVVGHSHNYYSKTRSEVGVTYLKLNNMLRYKYPVNGVGIFINGGFSNGFAVSEKNHRSTLYTSTSSGEVAESKALEIFRMHEQGFLLGAGAQFKKVSLEGRYEISNGMSGQTGLGVVVQRYSLLLAYRL